MVQLSSCFNHQQQSHLLSMVQIQGVYESKRRHVITIKGAGAAKNSNFQSSFAVIYIHTYIYTRTQYV